MENPDNNEDHSIRILKKNLLINNTTTESPVDNDFKEYFIFNPDSTTRSLSLFKKLTIMMKKGKPYHPTNLVLRKIFIFGG